MPALLDVPTGLGKTAAAILAWVWRRRFAEEAIRKTTPQRLVYCLPMRVLVEQTFAEAVKWLDRLGLLSGEAHWTVVDGDRLPIRNSELCPSRNGAESGYRPEFGTQQIRADGWAATHTQYAQSAIVIHLLLGGEERSDWALWPDSDAILIGTQDMLLSRALNRGYAAGRARWPMEFGLLNNDCLWVFDEIQLMDTGLATSLQLDAWRQSLLLIPRRSGFPIASPGATKACSSLWMSATMAKHWLERSLDWSKYVESSWESRHQLTPGERQNSDLRSGQLFLVTKALTKMNVGLEKPKTKDNLPDKADSARKQADYIGRLAEHVLKPKNQGHTGLTLVIVNTVDRATALFDLLRKSENSSQLSVHLIHSRFRPLERENWQRFLSRENLSRRILISTQVIEAGVDISATVLYTELAPWASLVQRFGRCARYPQESGQVFWLDLDLGSDKQQVDHWAKPYERADLVVARERLGNLKDVGLKSLAEIGDQLLPEALCPYEPRFVPRDKDLFDLFDTTPDLTGADVDISRFIRNGEELDIQVFWREIGGSKPDKKVRPDRRELCPVPFHRFQEFIKTVGTAKAVWRRNYRKGWESVIAGEVYPGQVYLLDKSCGGYSHTLGWTGEPADQHFDLPKFITAASREALQDEEDDADELSHSLETHKWLTVFEHTIDVCRKLDEILQDSGVPDLDRKILKLAARWHDRGKAHSGFQSKLKFDFLATDEVQKTLAGEPVAKAPDQAWTKGSPPGFRHELASALAVLETLRHAKPQHDTFSWPEGLARSNFDSTTENSQIAVTTNNPLAEELAALSADELDLLVYLVAAHHGKVRMSIRSTLDDNNGPPGVRQARGLREDDKPLPGCKLPGSDLKTIIQAQEVSLTLDLMDLGLSPRYGPSWRERTQLLLERLGPFKLAYLEALLRAADCRASIEENEPATRKGGPPNR